MSSDEELSRLAEAAILQEAKRGALRAELVGPSGWLKPKLLPTNKKFLRNTIKGALASNQVTDMKRKRTKEAKFEKFERELKERRKYKRCYLTASTKAKEDTKTDLTEKEEKNMSMKPVNGISWSDEGLEISCSISPDKRKGLESKKYKVPRNIEFITQSKTSKFGVT